MSVKATVRIVLAILRLIGFLDAREYREAKRLATTAADGEAIETAVEDFESRAEAA